MAQRLDGKEVDSGSIGTTQNKQNSGIKRITYTKAGSHVHQGDEKSLVDNNLLWELIRTNTAEAI